MGKYCSVLAAVCVTALVLAGNATAQAQEIVLQGDRKLCVTAELKPFGKITLEGCAGEAPQIFAYDRRSGLIRSSIPDLCIDLDRAPGQPEWLHLVRCDGKAQTMHPWTYDGATGVIRHAKEGICWDVPRGNFRSGQRLVGSRCAQRSASQQFAMGSQPAPAWKQPGRKQTRWLPGNGQACDAACRRGGGRAISSGEHVQNGRQTGDLFFVCAAEINGMRSGFNVRPHWANACMVPFGGKEMRMPTYLCLCE